MQKKQGLEHVWWDGTDCRMSSHGWCMGYYNIRLSRPARSKFGGDPLGCVRDYLVRPRVKYMVFPTLGFLEHPDRLHANIRDL